MNKWLKIGIGVIAVIALGIAAVFYFTSGMVDTADSFLKAVKARDIAKARDYLAEDFKAGTDEKALADFLSKGAILDFKEASWSNRNISGSRGELDGSITTQAGGTIPIKMMFVKEKGNWKIYSIRKPTAGLQSSDAAPAAPAKADQVALVKQSMRDFIVSLDGKNMEHFRSTVSKMWQKQHTTEQLNGAFKALINTGANWSVLNNLEPVLAGESTVDKDGVLVVSGYYPTTPRKVHFEQKYIYEGIGWKLLGLNIEVK
jgi:hypothetical protein